MASPASAATAGASSSPAIGNGEDDNVATLFAVFPCGIDDVVRQRFQKVGVRDFISEDSEVLREMRAFRINPHDDEKTGEKFRWIDKDREKIQALAASEVAASAESDSPTTAAYRAMRRTQGALFFRCDLRDATTLAQLCFDRTIETLCLHLATVPCAAVEPQSSTEATGEASPYTALRERLLASADMIKEVVLTRLSRLRAAFGELLRSDPQKYAPLALFGPDYLSPIHHVRLRASALRRERDASRGAASSSAAASASQATQSKRSAAPELNSMNLAREIGDAIMAAVCAAPSAADAAGDNTRFTPWEVNMLYHNVEFFGLLCDGFVHVGCVLNPPAFPRCGSETQLASLLYMELVRQRIGRFIDGESSVGVGKRPRESQTVADAADSCDAKVFPEDVRRWVSRPSTLRYDMRAAKGLNALHGPLCIALATYAGVKPGDVVLDPFAGCGSILVDAWAEATADFAPVTLLAGELYPKDARLARHNLQANTAGCLAALHGHLLTASLHHNACAAVREYRDRWLTAVRTAAETIHPPHLLKNELRGLAGTERETAAMQYIKRVAETLENDVAVPLQQELAARLVKDGSHCGFSVVGEALHTDARRLPYRAGTIDCVVSDLPFGRRCGNHEVNKRLYPRVVQECHRVLRGPSSVDTSRNQSSSNRKLTVAEALLNPGSPPLHEWRERTAGGPGRAVLLTVEVKLMWRALLQQFDTHPFKLVTAPFTIEMSGLFPFVFVLEKL